MIKSLFIASGLGWHNINFPDFSIEEGEFAFILGPSGSGKSTLLKLLNGVLSADRGELLYKGIPADQWDPLTWRRQVLLAGQAVYLEMGTIADNFAAFYAYRRLPCPSEAAMRAALDICCASFALDARCEQLSGGERQRVFLALVLSFASPVIMLDEPTSALDSAAAGRLADQLRGYCRQNKRTAVIVTHDLRLAEKYADKTIKLGCFDPGVSEPV